MVLVSNATRNGYKAACPSSPNKDNLRIISNIDHSAKIRISGRVRVQWITDKESAAKGATFGTVRFDGKHHYITTNGTKVFEVYSLLPLKLVLVYRIVRLLRVLLLGRWAAA